MLTKIDYAEIRYNIPAKDPNTGAYIVGQAMMPRFNHTYEMNPKERGEDGKGNLRYEYPNGLDVTKYPEDKEIQKSIKPVIDEARKALEKTYGEGSTDSFSPSWKSVKLEINKELIRLNLKIVNGVYENPDDARLYWAIKGGAFGVVATSLEELKTSARPARFVLVEPTEELEINVASDITNDRATVKLIDLYDSGKTVDLFYIHKNLISADSGTTFNTPKDLLYSDLTRFIKGELVKSHKKNCAKEFLELAKAYKEDRQRVITQAYLVDACYYSYVATDENKRLKNQETKTVLGTTLKDATSFLCEPKNQNELENLMDKVNAKWNAK